MKNVDRGPRNVKSKKSSSSEEGHSIAGWAVLQGVLTFLTAGGGPGENRRRWGHGISLPLAQEEDLKEGIIIFNRGWPGKEWEDCQFAWRRND